MNVQINITDEENELLEKIMKISLSEEFSADVRKLMLSETLEQTETKSFNEGYKSGFSDCELTRKTSEFAENTICRINNLLSGLKGFETQLEAQIHSIVQNYLQPENTNLCDQINMKAYTGKGPKKKEIVNG